MRRVLTDDGRDGGHSAEEGALVVERRNVLQMGRINAYSEADELKWLTLSQGPT